MCREVNLPFCCEPKRIRSVRSGVTSVVDDLSPTGGKSKPLSETTAMTQERPMQAGNGWVQLPLNLALLLGGPVIFLMGIGMAGSRVGGPLVAGLFCVLGVAMGLSGIIRLLAFP